MANQMMQDKASEMAATQTVPTGYKQTEVGVIPEDWSVLAISDRHEIATGNTPPTADTCNYGTDYLFIGPGDLGSGKYVFSSMKMLSSKGFTLARKFPAGSTLFTCIGSTIGKTGYVVDVVTSNQQINAVFPNELDDSEFTYYALTNIAPKVRELAGEQAVPLVNKKDFGEMKYCLPANKQEQTAIANVLSDSDSLIVGLEQLIAKKQAIKTATMQQLLTGRTRLPQFALRSDGTLKGYKSSELGQIPEDWAVAAVSEVLTEISMGPFGSDIKVSNFVKSGVPVLNGINVSASKLVDSFSNFVTHEKAKELNKAVASRGDVVVTHRGTIGQISYIPDDSLFDRYVISQSQFRARFNNQVLPVWVVLFFLSPAGSARLLEGKGHTGVPAIAQASTTFRKLKFSLPSLEEQTAIATILSDMDSELTALQQKLAKARDVKQGMMQQLLTGRIRLPVEQVE
ncbi:restriction endonuclease subunit S [Aeromonas jandaei]|uniref:restriction endonuclease subunit S n=1 Tax=Aeromonas jandaei TaxID=650 RepID=UPI003BA03720